MNTLLFAQEIRRKLDRTYYLLYNQSSFPFHSIGQLKHVSIIIYSARSTMIQEFLKKNCCLFVLKVALLVTFSLSNMLVRRISNQLVITLAYSKMYSVLNKTEHFFLIMLSHPCTEFLGWGNLSKGRDLARRGIQISIPDLATFVL